VQHAHEVSEQNKKCPREESNQDRQKKTPEASNLFLLESTATRVDERLSSFLKEQFPVPRACFSQKEI